MPDPVQLASEAERLSSIEYYDFLDALDEVHRRRMNSQSNPQPIKNAPKLELAHWIAKEQMLLSRNIREMWYLPANEDPNEFRFLEVNETSPEYEQLRTMQLREEISGSEYRISIADINRDNIGKLKTGQIRLPEGWKLDGAATWSRRS